MSVESKGSPRQRNIKLQLEYDGTAYKGWQIQPDQRTIQGELEKCLSRLLNEPIRTVAAGRTDAGVHARGQVANFPTSSSISLGRIYSGLNSLLPMDISVGQVEEAPSEFHARFDATLRSYEYRISFTPSALENRFVWWIRCELDIAAIQHASCILVGCHDFTSFCVGAEERDSRICHISRCDWEAAEEVLSFHIEGNRFLRSMVRGIVGTLVQVGRRKRAPQDISRILESRDRQRAGPNAPPQGLFLMNAEYKVTSGE